MQEFIVTDLSNFKIKHKRIYKRLGHFREVLGQFQGKEGKDIPRAVIEKLRENINHSTARISTKQQELSRSEQNPPKVGLTDA